MAFLTLYLEDLKALGRSRFLLFGLAAWLLVGALLGAFLGTSSYDVGIFFFYPMYVITLSAFAAFAAAQTIGPRSNHFVQAIFTAPVSKFEYLLAKFFFILTAGALYLALTMPYFILYAAIANIPGIYWDYLFVGAGLIVFGTVFGMFLGTIFTGRGTAAPITIGVLPIFLVSLLFYFFNTNGGNGSQSSKDFAAQLAHLSPQANLLEFVDRMPGFLGDQPERTLIVFASVIVGLLIVTFWAFLVHQSVEAWEGNPVSRPIIVLLGFVLLLVPAMVPAMDYEPRPETYESSGLIPGVERFGFATEAYIIERGSSFPADVFETGGEHTRNKDFSMGTLRNVDLLVVFNTQEPPHEMIAQHNFSISQIELTIQGMDGLNLNVANAVLEMPDLETGKNPSKPDQQALYTRIPATIKPMAVAGLSFEPYTFRVWSNVTWTGWNEEERRMETDTMPGLLSSHIRASYPGIQQKVLMAGAVSPVLLFLTGIVRSIGRR